MTSPPERRPGRPALLRDPVPGAGAVPTLVSAAVSHVGRVRSANEDSYLLAPAIGIYAVADGMGGHEGGALASATVVESLASIGPPVSAADLLARLEDRILRANTTLQALVARNGKLIGSTIAVLLVFGDDFACVWSGDSRIYRVRDDAIAQLSRDHTEAQDLVERGILTGEEARTWPRRNVITRAVGVRPEPELDLEHGQIQGGDVFLICSDGLTGHVGDAEILAVVARDAAPRTVCDALLDLTLERGATDNVTILVVRCEAARARTRNLDTTLVVMRDAEETGR